MLISRKFASAFRSSENCVKISQSFMLMSLGDLRLASYLSQLFYWHTPSKSNKYKLRVKKEDEYWIAKTDKDCFQDCFLSLNEIKKAKNTAIKFGLIKTKVWRFKGNPTTHITLTSKFEKILEKCADYFLDVDFPQSKNELQEVAKKLKIYKNSFWLKSTKRNSENQQNVLLKKHKSLTENTTENTTENSIIKNNTNESIDSYKQGNNIDQKKPILKKIKINKNKQKLRKNKSFAAKLKKRKLQQQKTKKQKEKIKTKPKYKHTIKDLRNYNELLDHGITDHRSDKPKNKSIDKLHALFSSQCKDPYHTIDTPEVYVNFKWDMDLLIEVFEYHLKHTVKFNMKPVKAIGSFIFSEGYNGFKSWSPLVHWHQKMTKTAENELTAEGKKFLSSLKRAKVHDVMDIDSSIINKVAKETYYVANNHVFMDGKTITMNYPCGIIDTLSNYIKEQTNRDNFKLVYITKNGFVDEFLDVAKKRNIIKPKINGRSIFS